MILNQKTKQRPDLIQILILFPCGNRVDQRLRIKQGSNLLCIKRSNIGVGYDAGAAPGKALFLQFAAKDLSIRSVNNVIARLPVIMDRKPVVILTHC